MTPDPVIQDLNRYLRELGDEDTKNLHLIEESDALAEEWTEELILTGVIKAIGYQTTDVLQAMECGADFEDTLKLLAYKWLENQEEDE